MVMRPDKFTESAQEVIAGSQELVRRLRATQWDVEHVFQAMLDQQGGLAAQILQKLGVDPGQVRRRASPACSRAPSPRLSGSKTSSSAWSTC